MSRGPSVRAAAIASAAVVAFAGVACSSGGPPDAGPTTSTPTPTSTERDIVPVDGDAYFDVVDTSSDPVLRGGSGRDADQEAVDAFADELVAWLDGHLEDLQSGGPGALETVAADGLLDGSDENISAAVTSGLVDPDDPVAAAEYHIQIGHRGEPEWALADVRVTLRDGATRRALFTFEAGDGGPVLLAVGPSRDDLVVDGQADADGQDQGAGEDGS